MDFSSEILNSNDGTIILIKDSRNSKIEITAPEVYGITSQVTSSIDSLLNKVHVKYSLFLIPQIFSSGANFYLGNRGITIGITPGNKQVLTDLIKAEMAHEYTHAMQFERGKVGATSPSFIVGNYSPYTEGLAYGVEVYTNYASSSILSQSGLTNCIYGQFDSNTIGRCMFNYLYNDNLLSPSFFKNLFNPQKTYDFGNYTNNNINNQQYCSTLNNLLSDALGKNIKTTVYKMGCTAINSQ